MDEKVLIYDRQNESLFEISLMELDISGTGHLVLYASLKIIVSASAAGSP